MFRIWFQEEIYKFKSNRRANHLWYDLNYMTQMARMIFATENLLLSIFH